jgi:hypothetical protein
VWLPLAYATQSLVTRLVADRVDGAARLTAEEAARLGVLAWLLPTLALGIAGAIGGYVLARWGQPSGPREAAEAGGVVGFGAALLTWARLGVSLTALVALAVVVPAALAGASLGLRARRRP